MNREKRLSVLVFVPSNNSWNKASWEFILNKSNISIPEHSALISERYFEWKHYENRKADMLGQLVNPALNAIFSPLVDDMTQGLSNQFHDAFENSFMYTMKNRLDNEEKNNMLLGYKNSLISTFSHRIKEIQNDLNFGRLKVGSGIKNEYDFTVDYLFFLLSNNKLEAYETKKDDLKKVLNHHNFVILKPTWDFFKENCFSNLLNFLANSHGRKVSLFFHWLFPKDKTISIKSFNKLSKMFPKINESQKFHFFNSDSPFDVYDLVYANRIKESLYFFPFEARVILKNLSTINKYNKKLLNCIFVINFIKKKYSAVTQKIILAQLNYFSQTHSSRDFSYKHVLVSYSNKSLPKFKITVDTSVIKLHRCLNRFYVTAYTLPLEFIRDKSSANQLTSITIHDNARNNFSSKLNLILKYMDLMRFVDVKNTSDILVKSSKNLNKTFPIDTVLIYVRKIKKTVVLALAFIIKLDDYGNGNRKNKSKFLRRLKKIFGLNPLILKNKISWNCMKLDRFKCPNVKRSNGEQRSVSGVTLQIVCDSDPDNDESILSQGLDVLMQFLTEHQRNQLNKELNTLSLVSENKNLRSTCLNVHAMKTVVNNRIDADDNKEAESDNHSVISGCPSLD